MILFWRSALRWAAMFVLGDLISKVLSFRGANATRNLLFVGGGRKQIPPLRSALRRNDKV